MSSRAWTAPVLRHRSRQARLALHLAAAVVVAGPITAPGQADAATASLAVAGAPLSGATLTAAASRTVSLSGSTGVSAVRWVLDGVYLGMDATAPFTVTITPPPGPHVLKARATVGGVVEHHEARFVTTTPAAGTPNPDGAAVSPPSTTDSSTSTSGSSSVRVSSPSALTAALRAARPGTVITLADGRYPGHFVGAVSGTSSAPVVLRGGRGAVLDGGTSGYTLHLDRASHWRLEGFTVTGGQKGVVLDRSTHAVLTGLDVGRTGHEAVHFRSGSSDGALVDSVVHDTGLVSPGFGEGVYIGSAKSNWGTYSGGAPDRTDRITVLRNTIYATTAESVDVKEGTSGGLIQANTFDGSKLSGVNYADSWIDVKGNGYRVVGNTGTASPRDGIQTRVRVGPGQHLQRQRAAGGRPRRGLLRPVRGDDPQRHPLHQHGVGCRKGLRNVTCS